MADFALIIHKNKGFAKWKKIYDMDLPNRKAAGMKEVALLRSESNPNEVVLLYKLSNLSKAKKFAASADLKAKMAMAGVIGKPAIYFLNDKK